jgi:hypothetical protein
MEDTVLMSVPPAANSVAMRSSFCDTCVGVTCSLEEATLSRVIPSSRTRLLETVTRVLVRYCGAVLNCKNRRDSRIWNGTNGTNESSDTTTPIVPTVGGSSMSAYIAMPQYAVGLVN